MVYLFLCNLLICVYCLIIVIMQIDTGVILIGDVEHSGSGGRALNSQLREHGFQSCVALKPGAR